MSQNHSSLTSAAAEMNIEWKFIPAYAPNFGGLWEVGVKSVKFHLKRVLGSQNFTYEVFYTLLTEIESILNSRPLSPLSTDPSDYSPLTPSHFLIGRAASVIPEKDWTSIPTNRLKAYENIVALKQRFWKRWSQEYVHLLQQRTKWKCNVEKVKLGQLVLIKDDTPPLVWALGRIKELHPGADCITRVVTIYTAKGDIKRAVNRICPLPMNNEDCFS